MCNRTYYSTCPYCDGELEESSLYAWKHGAFVEPIAKDTDQKGFIVLAFECQECDSEVFLNEAALLDRGYGDIGRKHPHVDMFPDDFGRGKSDTVMKSADALGMPILRVPIFKCHKYHIEINYDEEYLQDLAFAFGYEWESNGQKYMKTKFKYLSIEPETKRMWYNLDDPGNTLSNRAVGLKGFAQVLNGIEPNEMPSQKYPIEDWKYEVQNGDTTLGYVDWINHRIEADDG